MKRVRAFEVSPRDVIEQATKVLSALKLHTPPDVLAGALQGSPLFSSRQALSEDCPELTKALLDLDPYMRKSTLESALSMWNEQHKEGLSKHSQQTKCMWVKMEAYALKQLLMGEMKKAHNKKRTCASSSSHMGDVVMCLLGKSASSGSSEAVRQNAPLEQTPWVEKHRKLLRRRSSEAECTVIEKAPGVHQTKEDILALYGVDKSKEDILALYGAHQAKDEMAPRGMEEVIDLTDTPPKKPPSTQDTNKGKHKVYFDFHRGKVVRAWADGTVEESNTKEGDDGFIIGDLEDGFTFTSEVPNVAFHALESFQLKRKKAVRKKPAQAGPMEEPEESEEEQGSDDGAPAVLPAREDTVVHVFVSHVSTLCGWCCNASHIYVLNMFVRTQKVTSSRTSRSPGPKA